MRFHRPAGADGFNPLIEQKIHEARARERVAPDDKNLFGHDVVFAPADCQRGLN